MNDGISININKPIILINEKVKRNKKKVKTYSNPVIKKEKTLDEVKTQVSNALNKVGSRYVKFDNIDHTEGLMVCGVIFESEKDLNNENKVCFAVMNSNKKIEYVSSKEHFSILSSVPSSLYVLNYLNTREPDTLKLYADTAFKKDKVNVFTKIYIRTKQNKGIKK